MDIRDLKCFLHLCDSRHFGLTAKAMYVTPSTLSRQIQRLEHDLAIPLFMRDNRRVELTDAGEKLKQFAQQVLTDYKRLQQAIDHSQQQLSGELRIFCSVTAAYSHLPDILDRFRRLYPAVEITLSTGDAADAVNKISSNEADLAIAGRPQRLAAGVEFAKIGEIEMILLIPKLRTHFSEKLHSKSPEWQHIPFILPAHGPSRQRIDMWFKQQKISSPQIYATVAGHEAIVSMVALGCGVAILPTVVVENSPEQMRERIIEWSPVSIDPFDLGVCVQKRRLSEKVIEAFWQLTN